LGWGRLPLIISAANVCLIAAGSIAAWLAVGRQSVSVGKLGQLVPYAARKLTLYPRALLGRTGVKWVRTDRNGPVNL
jgi:hypothetical protein